MRGGGRQHPVWPLGEPGRRGQGFCTGCGPTSTFPSLPLKPERKGTLSCSASAGVGRPRELADTQRAGFVSVDRWVGLRLKEGAPRPRILPGSPRTSRARAYLENSQGKGKPVPKVFVLKSTDRPPASFEVVLGILKGLPWAEGSVAKTLPERCWCPGINTRAPVPKPPACHRAPHVPLAL